MKTIVQRAVVIGFISPKVLKKRTQRVQKPLTTNVGNLILQAYLMKCKEEMGARSKRV